MEKPIVVHHMTREQLDLLFPVFAKYSPLKGTPRQHQDQLDWLAPAWWYLAYETARS